MGETEDTVTEICKQLAWKKEKEQETTTQRGAVGPRLKEGREKRSVSKKGFDRELAYNLFNFE